MSSPVKYRSTNALTYPVFNDIPWHIAKANGDMALFTCNTGSTNAGNGFANRALQLADVSTALHATHPTDFAVDPTKTYRVGVWGFGGGNVNLLVTALDGNYGDISTLTIPLTLPATATLLNGEVADVINPSGGSAPAWPAGTIGARFAIQNNSAGSNRYIFAAYCIANGQLPITTMPASKPNGGGGTHEGVWDGTNLYVISHTYDQLAKLDADLNRVGICTTGDYPHDLVSLGSSIWVANFEGQTLQKIAKSTMTVSNTYTDSVPRACIGLCTDGTDIFMGAGTTAQGPAILKFTVASSTFGLISTDVDGGGANLPVRFLAGDLWSVKTTTSEVKRISRGGGATVKTVSCNIGLIYGLGDDGTLLYANGETGVVVIDPSVSSGTIVARYPFQRVYGGASNVRPDAAGRMWGATGTGAFMLDHANGQLWEIPSNVSGGPKWTHQFPGGMILGYYSMPSLDMFR